MIAIITPSRGECAAEYTYSLVQLVLHTPHDIFYATAIGSILPNLRNELAERAIRAECSHVLFVDSDMGFPSYALDRLVDRNLPIVGANCRQRNGVDYTAFKDGAFIPRDPTRDVERIDSVGLAFTLIKKEVLHAITFPWFGFAWDNHAKKFTGEDVLFTKRVREMGINTYVDHTLEVTHHVTQAL